MRRNGSSTWLPGAKRSSVLTASPATERSGLPKENLPVEKSGRTIVIDNYT